MSRRRGGRCPLAALCDALQQASQSLPQGLSLLHGQAFQLASEQVQCRPEMGQDSESTEPIRGLPEGRPGFGSSSSILLVALLYSSLLQRP